MRLNMVFYLLLLAIVMWPFSGPACTDVPSREAFDWQYAEDATPTSAGLLLVTYRDPETGEVDHVAYHSVLQSFTESSPEAVSEANTVMVQTDASLGTVTYVIRSHALLYGTSLDSQGLPRKVWIDSAEDGINGNERARE